MARPRDLINRRLAAVATEGTEGDWRAALVLNHEQKPRPVAYNVEQILRLEPHFRGRLRFDLLRGSAVTKALPWCPTDGWREWSDLDDIRLASWCQERDIPVRPGTCAEAVAAVAADDAYHPVRDYLADLEWDGEPRLDAWLISYAGADDGPYLREVGRKWCISALARIYEPGCKADCALVLEGRQGSFKSSLVGALAVRGEWFADELADLGSKDSAQDLRGKWIVEVAELAAMRRSEIERVKAFMSRGVDHYRPSYGRRSMDFPRQCVFAGTTNADAYLHDDTGNRRFWPVEVGHIDLAAMRRDVDQLWAEALIAYRAGERWHLNGDVEKLAREEQDSRRETDPWEESVLTWAGRQLMAIRIPAALEDLGLKLHEQDQRAQKRVASILRSAGYVRARKRVPGELHPKDVYVRVPPDGTQET